MCDQNDVFIIAENDTTFTKFKWMQTKLSGVHFSPRCSMPIVSVPNQTLAFCYGGVFDTEDEEENLAGNFFNDMFQLDLEKLCWRSVTISGKKDRDVIEKRRKNKTVEEGDDNIKPMEIEEVEEKIESTTISDDGIFKVTLGPTSSGVTSTDPTTNCEQLSVFRPSPRINCGLVVKRGVLYLYGGMFEDGDKQITYNDLYSLDIKKIDEWKTIIADDSKSVEWLGSGSEEESSGDNEEDDENSEDSEMDTGS